MSKARDTIFYPKWCQTIFDPSSHQLFSRQRNVCKMAWCSFCSQKIKVGGPQGATLGILEYLAQSNNSADCVPLEDRFKFVDDLTILEIVNLLTIGLSSFNLKGQVPSDIPVHGQFIDPKNLKFQERRDQIRDWTTNPKMIINETKINMIFN